MIFVFLINIAVIFGIYVMCGPGMIFGFMQNLKKDWLKKPLFDCPPCMSSLWGSLGFVIAERGEYMDLSYKWLPVYIIAMTGVNFILKSLVDKIYDITLNVEVDVKRFIKRSKLEATIRALFFVGGLTALELNRLPIIFEMIGVIGLVGILFIGIKIRE